MNSSMALPRHTTRPGAAIGWAGFVCGTLDITAAFGVYGFFGARPIPILHGIAAGLLGPRAHQGGMATAALGLACHYFIAFSAAAVYYVASRWLPSLVEHALVCGALYGVAVYFFMNRIVVPFSAARRSAFSWEMMFLGVAIHIFCVGLPIALLVRRYST